MLDALNQLESLALTELAAAEDPSTVDKWKTAYFGGTGKVKAALAAVKDVPKDQKPAYGQRINQIKARLEAALAEKCAVLATRSLGENGVAECGEREKQCGAGRGSGGHPLGPRVDVTEPGTVTSATSPGRRHIITRVREELVDVFARMGFSVATGPELEDDDHNFVKLNIPPDHPAREPSENFYIDDPARVKHPRMLRSQTSTVQIRVLERAVELMKSGAPEGSDGALPVRIVAPGRVYRPDTVDATHSFMFHQIEGLAVDRGISMADLKSTLSHFARAYFGPDAEVRLRPSYFPFTEPSAEFDMKISLRPDQPPRWIELGGCGMVDPAVFESCGIDPEVWTGFAFGFGIERLAMGKYGIPDIRMLYENDLRFLRQI